jgi:hypothetical protein
MCVDGLNDVDGMKLDNVLASTLNKEEAGSSETLTVGVCILLLYIRFREHSPHTDLATHSDTQLLSTLKKTAHKYSNLIEKLEDGMVLNNTKTQFDYVPQDF